MASEAGAGAAASPAELLSPAQQHALRRAPPLAPATGGERSASRPKAAAAAASPRKAARMTSGPRTSPQGVPCATAPRVPPHACSRHASGTVSGRVLKPRCELARVTGFSDAALRFIWAGARVALPFVEMGLISPRHALPICHRTQSHFQNNLHFSCVTSSACFGLCFHRDPWHGLKGRHHVACQLVYSRSASCQSALVRRQGEPPAGPSPGHGTGKVSRRGSGRRRLRCSGCAACHAAFPAGSDAVGETHTAGTPASQVPPRRLLGLSRWTLLKMPGTAPQTRCPRMLSDARPAVTLALVFVIHGLPFLHAGGRPG